MDRDFAVDLRRAYAPILTVRSSSASDDERIDAIAKSIKYASASPGVTASLLIKAGDASIGRPLVFTAGEKKLQIEPSTLRQYDVYWLQLAVSPNEELTRRSSELRFDVSLETPDCLVMDMFPIKIGTKINSKEKAS